jgi:hypothetical protein
MPDKKIEPWVTEEYAKEMNKEIDDGIKAGNDPYYPWTKEKEQELKKQVEQVAKEFRTETLKRIEKLGAKGYVEHTISEMNEELYRLQNPTDKEKYMYTEAYFKDLIEYAKDNIAYFESLLKDEELLESKILESKDRLLDIEKRKLSTGHKTLLQFPKTKYPNEFISPKDKVSNMLFDGKLSNEIKRLAMEGKGSKKELTTKVSIDFDELKGIYLISNQDITPYDREVHDAVVSLYIDGENEYVTPLMIYRAMTGNPGAELTDKIFNNITESIDRCSRTRVYIDATEEVKKSRYNMDQLIFKENLIYARSVRGVRNGKVEESIQILQTPILYRYANSKNQVSRIDIDLLNTPINKNEETVVLQGYLQRRIMSMKGSSRVHRNIVYETVYNHLKIEATSPGALRKKQSKIRDAAKRILDDWVEKEFITNYTENTGPNNSRVSVSIIL